MEGSLLNVSCCPTRAATLWSPTFARRVDSIDGEHAMTGNLSKPCELDWRAE